MNKDVIYIEPEEDITDIISKIEGSKSKIVAIVPPKKAGVFKSIVNIKLISKTAANLDKSVVLVTTDPSIIKLAAATKMPITKDLKTAPKIPEPDEEVDDTEEVDVDDEAEEEKPEEEEKEAEKEEKSEEPEEKSKKAADDEEEEDEEEDEEEEDEEEEKPKKKATKSEPKEKTTREKSAKNENKLASSNNPVLRWIGTHQRLSIGIGVGFVVFVFVMIWALVIAPAVTITLDLKTVTGNFSENISFTDTLADEKAEEGKFYIEEVKTETKKEVEFEATGKKNVGEKASGEITATYYFPISSDGGTVPIKKGTTFTNAGRNYLADNDAKIHWDGNLTEAAKDCENYGKEGWKAAGCKVSTKLNVTASDPGTNYNANANLPNWSTPISGLVITGNGTIAGGTDKNVVVVQQSDIDKAINDLNSDTKSTELKDKLIGELKDDQFAIVSSFKQTANDPVSSPEVGKEVEEGKKPKLTVTTTGTMFVMDETKVKEFIAAKAKLDKGYKIYEMNDPFVDNFVKIDSGYIGKLKTSYVAGSTITEDDVINVAKGKPIGTARKDLESNFDGIKTINISTSVPWATGVPDNPDKITIKINTEE